MGTTPVVTLIVAVLMMVLRMIVVVVLIVVMVATPSASASTSTASATPSVHISCALLRLYKINCFQVYGEKFLKQVWRYTNRYNQLNIPNFQVMI
jgi:hypothetical protein